MQENLFTCLDFTFRPLLSGIKWLTGFFFFFGNNIHKTSRKGFVNYNNPLLVMAKIKTDWIFAQHKTYDHAVQWSENQNYYLLAL